MTQTMRRDEDHSLETRPSLLQRLKTGDDIAGWQEFYRIYGGLIRSFAEKAGLTVEEAEEVVQETAIGVAKGLPDFIYDPKICRFKTWLLNLTRWRIQNQIRRRPGGGLADNAARSALTDGQPRREETHTANIDRIPDPAEPAFGAEWDAAWEKNLFLQALERVRPRLDERQFQAFDLYAVKQWPAGDVAQTLGINITRVYLTKHRVSSLLKKEIELLLLELEHRLEIARRGTLHVKH